MSEVDILLTELANNICSRLGRIPYSMSIDWPSNSFINAHWYSLRQYSGHRVREYKGYKSFCYIFMRQNNKFMIEIYLNTDNCTFDVELAYITKNYINYKESIPFNNPSVDPFKRIEQIEFQGL